MVEHSSERPFFARARRPAGLGRRLSVGTLAMGLVLLGLPNAAGAGQVWKVVPSANNGKVTNFLYDVSCVNSTTCTAVGFYTGASADLTLIETRAGNAWKVVPSPSPGGTWNFLYGVSCASAKSCMAVGRYENRTLAESWNGKVWAVSTTINRGTSTNALSGVSCKAVNSCVAVGSWEATKSGSTQALVEQWNGATWTVMPGAAPGSLPATKVSGLSSVSCVSAASCTAVGSYVDSNNVQQTLVERGNAGVWKVVPSPNQGALGSSLSDVSCASATSCKAVGTYVAVPAGAFGMGGVNQSFVESWNGIAWSIVPNPNPGTALTALSSVSCASTKACQAVGSYQNTRSDRRFTLVESWNGKAWSQASSPNPAPGSKEDNFIGGITGSGYNGVSCASATSCHAVGFHDDNTGHDQSLIERFG